MNELDRLTKAANELVDKGRGLAERMEKLEDGYLALLQAKKEAADLRVSIAYVEGYLDATDGKPPREGVA